MYGIEPRMYLENGQEISEKGGKAKARRAWGVFRETRAPPPPCAGWGGCLWPQEKNALRRERPASSLPQIAPATIVIGTVAVAIIAIAGTAFALSKESIPGVIAVWVALFAPVAYFVAKFGDEGDEPPK